MKLGAFSVSLAVKNLEASRNFYEMLGFSAFHGDPEHGFLIVKNGEHVIGLFQGMLDQNILTFNPGWDQAAQPVDPFTDIRVLQKALKAAGAELISEADEDSDGPTSLMLKDPDGNTILIDQHRQERSHA